MQSCVLRTCIMCVCRSVSSSLDRIPISFSMCCLNLQCTTSAERHCAVCFSRGLLIHADSLNDLNIEVKKKIGTPTLDRRWYSFFYVAAFLTTASCAPITFDLQSTCACARRTHAWWCDARTLKLIIYYINPNRGGKCRACNGYYT